MQPVVSIVIPSFNRGHLLGATLDSIIAQSFQKWECIIVDDGSTDYTSELMEFYLAKDARIRFYSRPSNRKKGANACRNYGFEISNGKYIQWFDSDDLMVEEFLQEKIEVITNSEADYVVSKAVNFKDPDPENILHLNEQYYTFSKIPITHYNYVVQKVNWLTYDFLAKRELCEKLSFNENLNSAQERNYFSILTCYSVNAKVIDKYLTKRRIHPFSTQARFNNNRALRMKEYLEFLYETWNDLKKISPCSGAINFLFKEGIKSTMNQTTSLRYILGYTKGLFEYEGLKTAFWYLIYQLSIKTINKGYMFRRKFLDSYQL